MKRSEAQRLRSIVEKAAVSLDDATASIAPTLFPAMKYDGELIKVGTRINWNGVIKRASVDIWDNAQSNPDNAPTLWVDLDYREGYRIIPETITVSTAFAEGEYGWWGDELYKSKVASNVYTPTVYPVNWEKVN